MEFEKGMSLCDFQRLNSTQQLDLLRAEGSYIGKRKYGHTAILLYQLEGFYVEIFYRRYRSNISQIRCTDATTILDPYLEQIAVELVID